MRFKLVDEVPFHANETVPKHGDHKENSHGVRGGKVGSNCKGSVERQGLVKRLG